MEGKPKLVFFQSQYVDRVPAFLQIHKQEHVKCLSEWFHVVVISKDCDFQQVCDDHEPDLVLVESAYSGASLSSCPPVKVNNRRACPQVPRAGFLHADAYCSGRAGFLSDMDQWDIETIFAIAVTAPEHTPEIANRCFIWPNFIDPETYHDYRQWKSIPVLFTGNKNALYPWRQKIIRAVSKNFPSLICPHPGYGGSRYSDPDTGAHASALLGEEYARTLNASWFVPACGGVAKELLRKHLEVPACKACLVTEKSAPLVAAGFADMENCVFADEHDVVDKIAYLLRTPGKLQEIIDRGHDLVHSQHTLKHRNQIFEWFRSYQLAQSHQQIIQESPFGGFRLADKSSGVKSQHITAKGAHLAALRDGDAKLIQGKYDEALELYTRCRTYIPWMPEPQLGMALCQLYKGNAKAALSSLSEPLSFTLADYKANDPDPVEWAYFIVALLCLGRTDEAVRHAREFARLRHPELDRVRWVTGILGKDNRVAPWRCPEEPRYRASVHRLPSYTVDQWIEQLCTILRACGQRTLTDVVMKRFRQEWSPDCHQPPTLIVNHELTPPSGGNRSAGRRHIFAAARRDVVGNFTRHLLYLRIRTRIRLLLRSALHWLEAQCGYFLPHRLSESKNDEFFHTVEQLSREEDISAALIVGAAVKRRCTQALLAGALANANRPSVFCIGGSGLRTRQGGQRPDNRSCTQWRYLSSSSQEELCQEAERVFNDILKRTGLTAFDVVLIDGSEATWPLARSAALIRHVQQARFVLLDDLVAPGSRELHHVLSQTSSYRLVAQNPGLRNGYAVFEKALGGPAHLGSDSKHQALGA